MTDVIDITGDGGVPSLVATLARRNSMVVPVVTWVCRCAVFLIALGTVYFVADYGTSPHSADRVSIDLLIHGASSTPLFLIAAGLALLAAWPVIAVLFLTFHWIRVRHYKVVADAGAVTVLLILSAFLA